MGAKSNEMQDLSELSGRVAALESQFQQFRDEVRAEFSATREDLQGKISAGDEETRTLMRVLHEDLVHRISLIDRG